MPIEIFFNLKKVKTALKLNIPYAETLKTTDNLWKLQTRNTSNTRENWVTNHFAV